jgi:hypothetical protein
MPPLPPAINAFPKFHGGFDVVLGGFAQHFYFLFSALCFRLVVALPSFSALYLDCSLAEKIFQERDKPRNTPNTRKANREEVCFPRISRIPRSNPPAFGCGFAALCLGLIELHFF